MATPDTVTPAPKSHKSLPRTTLSYIHLKALRTVPGSGIPGPGNGPVTRRRGTRAGTEGRTGAARTSAGRPTPDSEPDGEGAPPAPDLGRGDAAARGPRGPPAPTPAPRERAMPAGLTSNSSSCSRHRETSGSGGGGSGSGFYHLLEVGVEKREKHNALSKSVPLSRNAIVYLRQGTKFDLPLTCEFLSSSP